MERTGDQPRDGTPVQRVEVSVSTRSVAIFVVLAALIAIAIVLLDTLVSIAIALIFALALSVPVDALERRGMRRGLASVLVFALAFVCVFVLVAAIANPVYDEARQFADALPGYVEDLENDSAVQGLLQDADLTEKIKDGLQNFAGELPSTAGTVLGTAGGIFGSVLNLVTLTFLTLYLVVELPRIQHGIAALMRPDNAERFGGAQLQGGALCLDGGYRQHRDLGARGRGDGDGRLAPGPSVPGRTRHRRRAPRPDPDDRSDAGRP